MLCQIYNFLDFSVWTGWVDYTNEGDWNSYEDSHKILSNQTFQPWKNGEPNGGHSENCAASFTGNKTMWTDSPCSNSLCAVYQMPNLLKFQLRGNMH